ncbi:hypothetical protein CIPAW_08G072700 [Carya illinoinensis]|uniref:Uncharacterized protein n=1 Tax=Carya illinoinensis TaxID=32201 RepID=A0A8T1PTU2_CARIL|nr:hypothetical protein CIPAW_08G072700 [Carya illinoinensis]
MFIPNVMNNSSSLVPTLTKSQFIKISTFDCRIRNSKTQSQRKSWVKLRYWNFRPSKISMVNGNSTFSFQLSISQQSRYEDQIIKFSSEQSKLNKTKCKPNLLSGPSTIKPGKNASQSSNRAEKCQPSFFKIKIKISQLTFTLFEFR